MAGNESVEFVVRIDAFQNDGTEDPHFVVKTLPQMNSECHRDYTDFVNLSRQIGKNVKSDGFQFPKARLKNLMESGTWHVEATGWNPTLTKSLSIVNNWLRLVSIHYPEHIQVFCDNHLRTQRIAHLKYRRHTESNARQYQQYFTNTDTITQMIELAVGTPDMGRYGGVVCIEPSCGDGRVVMELFKHPKVHSVIGYEIDPCIGQYTKGECEREHGIDKCHIHIGDFLNAQRGEMTTIPPEAGHDVVIIGNPPYTEGGGTGKVTLCGKHGLDTDRILPLLFLIHAAKEFSPLRMVFLVPTRCAHAEYISQAKRFLRHPHAISRDRLCVCDTMCDNVSCETHGVCASGIERITASDTVVDRSDVVNGDDWEVTHISPRSRDFQFCDRIVKQSVVIQVWQRQVPVSRKRQASPEA